MVPGLRPMASAESVLNLIGRQGRKIIASLVSLRWTKIGYFSTPEMSDLMVNGIAMYDFLLQIRYHAK